MILHDSNKLSSFYTSGEISGNILPEINKWMPNLNSNRVLVNGPNKHFYMTFITYDDNTNLNIIPIDYQNGYTPMIEKPPDIIEFSIPRFLGYDSTINLNSDTMLFTWFNWQWNGNPQNWNVTITGYTITSAWYELKQNP